MRIFLAGATGAIGRRLVPQLVAAGHQVVATTRSPAKVEGLQALGAEPVVVDGLDAVAVGEAVGRAEPHAIIHQMTSLANLGSNMRRFDATFAVTNELRTKGTDHLLAAANASGVRRLIVQSYTGWPNIRDGGPVKTELDPLDPTPPASQRQTLAALEYLERTVVGAPLEGVALRYGSLYGPDTSNAVVEAIRKRQMPIAGGGAIWSMIHVDDAASATVAALTRGAGVYNIVDDEPAPISQWLPYLADALGAKPPYRVPIWLARLAGGDAAVSMLNQIRGSSNAKAKRELDWQPVWASWRDGFRHGLTDRDIEEWRAAKA